MKKKVKPAAVSHEGYLEEKLKDTAFAARYLSEIIRNSGGSDEDFEVVFLALEKMVRAAGISDAAGRMGIARDTLYKVFREHRNPTVKVFRSMLNAVDLELAFVPKRRA